MTWTVTVNNQNQLVTSTSVVNTITVNADTGYAFTLTEQISNIDVDVDIDQFDIYPNAVELRLGSLEKYFRGAWVSGTTYQMNDIVEDSVYNIYILKEFSPDLTETYTSTIPPGNDTTYWKRIYWKSAPFTTITVNNTATFVSGSTTSTINGGVINSVNGFFSTLNASTINSTINNVSTGIRVGPSRSVPSDVYAYFNTSTNFYKPVNFLDPVEASNITVNNLTVQGIGNSVSLGPSVISPGFTKINVYGVTTFHNDPPGPFKAYKTDFNAPVTVNNTATFNNSITIKGYQEAVSINSLSGTFQPDVSTATIWRATLTGNIVFNGFTNPRTGQSAIFVFRQDSTGGRTLESTIKFSGNYRKLSTFSEDTDIITVLYDGVDYWANLSKGFR